MMRTLWTTLLPALLGAALLLPLPTHAGVDPSGGEQAPTSPVGTPAGLPDTVTLTEQQIEDRGIRVAAAPAGTAESTIQAPATVQFEPGRVARIGPRLPAKVVQVTRGLGDVVEPGDTVAILDSVELGKVKARYLSVRARFDLARESHERESRLVAQKISSEAELQQARADLEQAQAELDSTIEELRLYGLSRKEIDAIRAGTDIPFSRYALTTPQAGVVEKLDLTPGQTLTPEMTPIEVVDPGRMRISIDAFERDVQRIRPGQQVSFTPAAVLTVRLSGTVDWIGQALSRTTRTLEVQATVSNPDGVLRAGMFGTARIALAATARHALLPVDAVQTVDGKNVVFKPLKGHPGSFAVAVVGVGDESGGDVEILTGVSPGEPVVTEGAFALMSILTAGTRQDTD